MLETVQEHKRPPALMSVIFTAISLGSMLFLLVFGNAIYGRSLSYYMRMPHTILSMVLVLAGLATAVIAVARAKRSGQRIASSLVALAFAIVVTLAAVALLGVQLWDKSRQASYSSHDSTTSSNKPAPSPTADSSGRLRIETYVLQDPDIRTVELGPGESKEFMVRVKRGQ
jgi:hypothetical protein